MRLFKSELTLSVLPYVQHRLTLCPTHLKVTKPTTTKEVCSICENLYKNN